MRVFVLILGGKDLFSCFVVLGLKPTASCMPGKQLYHQAVSSSLRRFPPTRVFLRKNFQVF